MGHGPLLSCRNCYHHCAAARPRTLSTPTFVRQSLLGELQLPANPLPLLLLLSSQREKPQSLVAGTSLGPQVGWTGRRSVVQEGWDEESKNSKLTRPDPDGISNL